MTQTISEKTKATRKPVMRSIEGLLTKAEPQPAAGAIELALLAPHNEFVELLADWNDWKPLPMTRGGDGWWRVAADDVPDGEHRYRFRVKSTSYFQPGKVIEVPDPYALQITRGGSAGYQEDAILRVKDGKRVFVEYDWRHDAVPLPTNDKLVIYELHVGDFTGTAEQAGTLAAATAKVDYLKDLGFNAIELLPVKEFPGRSWGYSLKSLFAVENSYGTPEDLCRFVDECHARGIRVIVDGVYNHAHQDAYLAQIAYEYWFHKDNPDGPEMDWGPKYNYQHFDETTGVFPARKYVADSIAFWVEQFHIDGIRFDATAAIKHFDVLKELADVAYAKVGERKPFLTVAEHVPEDPAVTGRDRGAPVDAAWHDWLGHVLRAAMAGVEQNGNAPDDLARLLDRFDPAKNGYGQSARTITFLGNHDYKRPMQVLGEDAKTFGDAAFRRMKLGAALLLTAPGIPMIWMGSEFGMPSDKSLDPRPVRWDLLQNKDNADLLEFHRKLIRLRHDVPALRGDGFETLLCDEGKKLIAFKRWTDNGSVAVVLANFRDEPAGDVSASIKGVEDGAWRDALGGSAVEVKGGALTTPLGASEVKVFVKA